MAKETILSRDAILALDDLNREAVFVPEWNGSVYVRALTGAERIQLSRLIASGEVTSAAIVALCVCDEQGNRLFTDADVEALAGKHGKALETIVQAIFRVNLLTSDAIDEAGNALSASQN